MLSRAADLGACWTLIAVGVASGVFPRRPALVAAAAAAATLATAASAAAPEPGGGGAVAGSGLWSGVARADGGPPTAAARRLAAATGYPPAACSDGGGGDDAMIRLLAPGWTLDYGACSPALQSVRECAKRLLDDLPASGWLDDASKATSCLFAVQQVQEAALLSNESREALGRSGDKPDVGVPLDWERSAVAAFQRRFGACSAPWTEPFYVCSAGEWRAILSVEGGRWKLFVLVSLAPCNIGQCRDSAPLFDIDRCDKSHARCESTPGSGLGTGSHRCTCRSCKACDQVNGNSTKEMHSQHNASWSASSTSRFFLEICSTGSSNDNLSLVPMEGHHMVRLALLVSSGACIVLCWVLMVVVMMRRDSKVIVSAKWIVLDMVLVGATLLYGSVLVEYFPPEVWSCLLRPWLRELGFGCTYGALNIKTYKVLAEFRTRKARRVHVRDKDLIKYWLLVVGAMTFYMASWTATNISYLSSSVPYITGLHNASSGRAFEICVHSAWDIVTELMELALVTSGLYMSYRIRRAPSLFWESKFVTAIFIMECLVSGGYYVARHCVLLDLGPEWVYALSFCRTQMTVTLLLLLLFGPKLWYMFHPPGKGSPWSREGPNADLLGYGANINGHRGPGGDSEIVDISLKEMEPDEIWQELRRVYTQLQLLKVKVMRYENPHIHEKKHHRIRKQLYSRISRSGHHHKARPDCSGCAPAAAAAAGDDEYGCSSHDHELLGYESGHVATAAAGNALH